MKTLDDIVHYIVRTAITRLAWNAVSETEFYMYKISIDYLDGGVY